MTKEFQFIYKGMPFSSEDKRFNWHKFTCTIDRLLDSSLNQLTHLHSTCELIAKRQFIGRKDKEGGMIFEGDILRCCHDDGESNYAGVVTWFNGGDWLGWGVMIDGYPDMILDDESYKVIGNIHENPGLIKVVESDD